LLFQYYIYQGSVNRIPNVGRVLFEFKLCQMTIERPLVLNK